MGAIFCRPTHSLPMAGHSLKHPSPGNRKSGAHWEKTAETYLLTRGLVLLQRNFSSRFGEIDLIMEDEKTLVFVEVKYRKSNHHGSGADAVTYHKQNRISLTAAWYLAKNPHRSESVCRFDVISINPDKRDHGINWVKAAFYSTLG